MENSILTETLAAPERGCNLSYIAPLARDRGMQPAVIAKCVEIVYSELNSWRMVSRFFEGFTAAYWRKIAHGECQASRRAENLVRRKLGIAPKGKIRLDQFSAAELKYYLRNRKPINIED